MVPTEGLFTASEEGADVPPPGVEFTAVSERLPAADTSTAMSVTLTSVALEKLVVRALPLMLMTVLGMNPVPVTASARDAAPSVSADGDRDVIAGTGLVTSRLIAEPLDWDPFTATTLNSAPPAICAAGTLEVTCVELT